IAREMHVRDTYSTSVQTALSKRFQISLLYSDGFGRELQTKVRAENGDAPKCGPDQAVLAGDPPTATGDVRPGDLVRNPNRDVVRGPAAPRWVGTGRTVYNNKGKPVKQYEPFFSSTHLYEDEPDMTDTGVSSVLFYASVERLLALLHPI